MKTIFALLIASFCAQNTYSQGHVFLMDSVMNIYMENGFANEHFMPEGKTDENELRQGFWKDYEVIEDYAIVSVLGEPEQQFGLYLYYGEGKFVNGKRQGPWKFYIIEDKTFKLFLSKEASFVNGEIEGICRYYYPSGNLGSIDNHVSGQAEGEIRWFYEEGQMYGRSFHVNGLRNGTSKYYYRSGELQYEMNFVNDSLNGKSIAYYQNGKLQEAAVYNMNQITGMYQYYYSNGQLWIEKEYKDGLLMNVKGSYDQQGKRRDYGTLKNGTGTVKYYTEEGKVYTIKTYQDGVLAKEEDF